jgi:hypothetical protein
MKYGKQVWFCPNCGAKYYNASACATSTRSQVASCYLACLKEWETKYARWILGKDQE